MANKEHLKILKQGVEVWNNWRRAEENFTLVPDLTKADLSDRDLREGYFREVDFSGANLTKTNFRYANLSGSDFIETNLFEADLSHAKLMATDFYKADLRGAKMEVSNFLNAKLINADLRKASLIESYIRDATFHRADLRKANLSGAQLLKADLSETKLNEAKLTLASLCQVNLKKGDILNVSVYGTSAWEVELEGAKQSNLIITKANEPVITVDNLEVAQFIYLLVHNKKIRHVIDTITSKVILILGRFTKPRKAVLDAIRNELRQHDYVPVLFDFDKPSSRDIHETVGTLARMARFVIADITNPRCIPQELGSIVEQLPSLPVQPLLKYGSKPWAMYDHIKRYPWVLEIHKYRSLKDLLGSLRERVISPAEKKWLELNEKG